MSDDVQYRSDSLHSMAHRSHAFLQVAPAIVVEDAPLFGDYLSLLMIVCDHLQEILAGKILCQKEAELLAMTLSVNIDPVAEKGMPIW